MKFISNEAKSVYTFINNELAAKDQTPSIREIEKNSGLSTRKVLNALRELEDALIIKRSPYRSRSIEIITSLDEETGATKDELVSVPILGTAPGGPFLLATQNLEDRISVPLRLLKGRKDVFLLRMTGNSMSPYLEDGDLAIIKNVNSADSGDVIVAVVQSNSGEYEATIKEYYSHNNQIILNPINKKGFKPIVENRDSIKIQGVVIGAIKLFNE